MNAVNDRLAERYLLEEMSAVEAEEFERHYFECEECAMAVESGQLLVANTRAVLAEAEADALPQKSGTENGSDAVRESFWGAFTAWWTKPATLFPALASVMFGALALYQGAVVIPDLRAGAGAARVLPAFQLVGASRGDTFTITIAPGTPYFALSADVPPDLHFPKYLCELTIGERTLFGLSASAPGDGQPITILVPAKDLQTGSYDLKIYGEDAGGRKLDRISTFSFALKIR